MASIRVSELTPTATAAADSFLYLADTTNGGVDFDSKKITVANFLNAYATETFVNSAIENLINGAPEALDTLKEISDAIGDSGDIVGNLIGMINANEVHMDNMASLSGVAKDETGLGSFSGSTIGDGSDIKSALQALETSLELKASSSAVNSNVSNTNDLVSLSGMAAGSVNMGLFDGDTLSDNATLKVVLQSAETAIEANASAISQEVSDRAAADTALSNADTALSNRLDTLEADPTTQTLLSAEAASRVAADSALSGRLDTLEADPTTQTLLDAETAARIAGDALLLPLAGGTMSGNITFGGAGTADLVNVDFTDAADASIF
ncbi:MAG: hypothetical protein VXY99_09390, partial [Pseudomonadota bacterium]|nr:hypothetical protein [Pseudomonadota bacterium]